MPLHEWIVFEIIELKFTKKVIILKMRKFALLKIAPLHSSTATLTSDAQSTNQPT